MEDNPATDPCATRGTNLPSDTKSSSVRRTGSPLPAWWASRKTFVLTAACYFLLQLVSRVALSSSAHLDESEQVLLGQFWSWGYGPQPPLYTWLQIPFLRIFGTSIFALSLLKNLLLFGTYVLAYENGRKLCEDPRGGWLAGVGLLFLPQVAWESQRDLTHSVLAALVTLATLRVFLNLMDRRSMRAFIGFGACVGLGGLAKYNYLFFPAGLLVAALTTPRWRPILFSRGMLVAGAIAISMTLPHTLWMVQHTQAALLSSGKFQLGQGENGLLTATRGLGGLIKAVVSFLGPLAAIFVVVFATRTRSPASTAATARAVFLAKAMAWVVGMLAILVIAFQVTGVRGRWLQPVLIGAPVLVAAMVPLQSVKRMKLFLGLGFVAALTISLMIPGRIALGEWLKRDEPLMRPYDKLAREVQQRIQPGDVVVSDTGVMAGNLRLNLPRHLAATPHIARLFVSNPRAILLAWDATRSPEMPEALVNYVRTLGREAPEPSRAEFVSATFKYHEHRQARLGMVRVEPTPISHPSARAED